MNLRIPAFLLLVLVIIQSCSEAKIENGIKTIHFPKSDIVKQTIQYKDGRKNGFFHEYFRNGQLKAKQFYLNDTLEDTTIIFHPNGKLKTLHVYKNKKRTGCWRDYNDKGKLISEIFFKENQLDSVCSKYSYRTNRPTERISYKEGLKHGVEEYYYPTGQISCRMYNHEGQLCLGTEEWSRSGKKKDLDFKISVLENDGALLNNKLIYYIRLDNPKVSDKVYRLIEPLKGKIIGGRISLRKHDNVFVCEFDVLPGGFVMEEVTVAAYRKTDLGNTVIKTKTFNAASNNF